ncbi:serine hydrolase domain-containing protein [Peristeroidobacter agariperforans]|uniref:serine hydrolase domain-containing protein n=1 Tax=Peristeroidobacter agariperforans TaxID=268404 RepID=UPI00101DE7AA|nr:serine hydrolase domain-containing protein [Peristeroidobacter agariperforans]
MIRAISNSLVATIAMSWATAVASEPVALDTAAASSRLDAADLHAWLDGIVPYALDRGRIAGGVIVVVQDGRVILKQGYGYADVADRVPVDAEQTLFRIGSVSKLFTWTAVMQLVEQGKLDLDRDIAEYLDIEMSDGFEQPITMRHLMMHTAGFEERLKGTVVAHPEEFPALRAYVKASMPARIAPPGKIPAYSNYGAALAGYVVEKISGETFDDYLQRAVFAPLGMTNSTSRQPLPPALATHMSQGYKVATQSPWYFELIPAPAGGISATGADMAQFMIAHLAAARDADSVLLRAATAHTFHDSISKPMPGLSGGVSLGIVVNSEHPRIIGHGGNTQVFHSDLKLFMENGVGWFAAFNSTGAGGAVHDLLKSLSGGFTRRYFARGGDTDVEPTMPTAAEHGRQLAAAGKYERSRGRADTFFGSLSSLVGQQSITLNADNTISIPSAVGLDGVRKRWREVAPYVWREVGGTQRLVARIDAGQVKAIGMDSLAGTGILLPVPTWRSSGWIFPVLFTAVAVLVVAAICMPVAALVRRHYQSPLTLPPPASPARVLSRVAVIANLSLLAGWVVVLRKGLNDFSLFTSELDVWLRLLHLIGVAVAMLSIAAVWNAWLSWRSPHPRAMRIGNSAIAAACCVVAAFAFAFNLVTLGLDY